MKIIERIFENVVLALCFLLMVMPIVVRKYLLEMKDWVRDTIREL